MNIIRGTIVCAAAAAMALGLAAPAAAATPPDGNYTATLTKGSGILKEGSSVPATFVPCGPDCVVLTMGPGTTELRPQGALWAGSYTAPIGACNRTLDVGTLVVTEICPNTPWDLSFQLAKVG